MSNSRQRWLGRSGCVVAAGACALLGGLAWPVAAGANDLATVLQRERIQVLNPPQDAPDFTLASTSGRNVSLSDHHGHWTLLSFWATWCGPCLSELPALQHLHATQAPRGMEVLGVAVNSDPAQVRALVERKKLTFDTLHDPGGKVSAMFQATGVPVSFLIDPAGRVVGVARGARDWSRAESLVNDLLALVPPSDSAERRYRAVAAAPPVDLPADLVPPSGEVLLPDRPPWPGQVFEVVVRVRWSGNLTDYVMHPPELHLPAGIVQDSIGAETSGLEGDLIVNYRVRLRAEHAGRFALDPVELRYTPQVAQAPVAERIAGPTVVVEEARILGLTVPWMLGLVGAVLAAAVLGAGLVAVRRRRNVAAPEPAAGEGLTARFQAARARRVAGDVAGFLEAAAELRRELGAAGGEEADFQALLERVRYGGERPAEMELDRLERGLERAIDARTGTPDDLDREGIRLTDER